ncbi:hypothetical protein [Sutcliffiella halmapala]|uniref:hypothetical protein n=1 Tax=Sutcliffiella halmapala TaxID=79882 RepID=UPI001472B55A|nr:hypothetical protein [Sutcliffiella halmapala]
MKTQFNQFPKTIKKTIRYINQDATYEQLQAIKSLMDKTIQNKFQNLKQEKN